MTTTFHLEEKKTGTLENLRVCRRCLAAIESREGRQCVSLIDIEMTCEPEEQESVVCDWCGDWNPTLYEIQ